MTALDDLAAQVHTLQKQVTGLTRPSQLANSSIEQAGETLDLADAATTAVSLPATIAGLQEILDTNEETLAAVRIDVQAAIDAAQEASDAGVAAGELANEAADNALEKAQEALDAAAAAGGGATYSGSAPTSSTPGVPGQQWFVWDSNYKINAYYVYDGATSAWVQTEITDAVLGNISAGSITSGYLGAERIAAASLTAAVLAADTITSREIAADAILARNIKAAEITGDKIAARTIAAGSIQANSITAAEIKAGTITASQIAAGSITANEINLDTLNGKTLTGTLVKTAASGARLELLGTRLDIYSAGATSAASISGFIYGTSSYAGLLLRASGPNGDATCILYSPESTTLSGAWTGTVKVSANITSGLATPDLVIRRVFAGQSSATEVPKLPVIEADSNGAPNDAVAAGTRFYGNRFSWIDPYGRTPSVIDIVKPAYAASNGVLSLTKVIVTAGDFQLLDGTSIVPAAGTASYNSAVAAGGNASVSVTFPFGQFSKAPIVVVTPSNGRFTATAQSITTSGFTVSLTNVTSATGTPGTVSWIAQPAS